MRNNPRSYEIYEHFKGNKYQIIVLAENTETGEDMVVYQSLNDHYKIYTRPLSMFLSEVDSDKYPEHAGKYRFTLIGDLNDPLKKMTEAKPAISKTVDSESLEKRCAEPTGNSNVSVETAGKENTQPKAEKENIEPEAVHQNTKPRASRLRDEEAMAESVIDPIVLDFLDAESHEERLNILASLRHRITDEMINTMAIALDVEVQEGSVDERYEQLRYCLNTFQKYESTRRG